MTHNRSIVMICPAASRETALTAGVALGIDAGFIVPLSGDGTEPATHYGCHMWQTDEVAAVLFGQAYPTTMPEGMTEASIDAILAAITVSVDPIVNDERLVNRAHFDHVTTDLGLQIVAPEI